MIIELGPCGECGRDLFDWTTDHSACLLKAVRRASERMGEKYARREEEAFWDALEVPT
ncbi:MAG: hypothetical protein ACYS5V_10380 [Planctomycetota bacterium]|jgi:hypothetical protein